MEKPSLEQLTPEEDRKLTHLIVGMLSRAYELEVGKDISVEKLEEAFAGRPELKNLKAAMVEFMHAVIHPEHVK